MTMVETFSLGHLKLSASLETQRSSLVSIWKWIMPEKRKQNPKHYFYLYGHAYDDVYSVELASTPLMLFPNGLQDKQSGVVILERNTSATCFLLHCQKFIELIRAGKLEEAVAYGRIEFEKVSGVEEFRQVIEDCAALLAYEQPQKSSVGYLLSESQREIVADTVNAMILSTNPKVEDSQGCLHSYLERLLRQLTACYLEKRSLNGDQGEAFHLRRVLNYGKKD